MFVLYGLFPAARFPERIVLGPTIFDHLSRLRPEELTEPADLERYRQLAANIRASDGSALAEVGVFLMEQGAFEGENRIGIARFARDAVSLSAVIAGTESNAIHPGNWTPCVPDFFEPLPVLFNTQQGAWVVQTQNMMGFTRLDLINPRLPIHLSNPDRWTFDYDDFLLLVLGALLTRYAKGRHSARMRLIERAIGLTFNASLSFPGFTGALGDFTNRITTWVSAFETLCHPMNKQKVKLSHVLGVIRTADWWEKRLRERRFAWKWEQQGGRETLPEAWYRRLYNLRNALAHGNPIRPDHLPGQFRFRRTTRMSLHLAAPLVFRACLLRQLSKVNGLRRVCNPPPMEIALDSHYQEGIANVLGLGQPDRLI